MAVVVETLVKAEVHRLVVTDQEKRVSGIVSLSDVLSYLVLRHTVEGKCCFEDSSLLVQGRCNSRGRKHASKLFAKKKNV